MQEGVPFRSPPYLQNLGYLRFFPAASARAAAVAPRLRYLSKPVKTCHPLIYLFRHRSGPPGYIVPPGVIISVTPHRSGPGTAAINFPGTD